MLQAAGIETWYSKKDIVVAVEWERSIKTALKSCDWFLLLMSPRSLASEWVLAEVDWAIRNRKSRFIPVLIEDCDAVEFHLWLPRIQHIDYRSDRATAKQALVSVLQLRLPTIVADPVR